MSWLLGCQWKNSGPESVQTFKFVWFGFAFLACCLIVVIRLRVSEDLPCMGAGGVCTLVQVEHTDTAWCCLTLYYPKRCMMRQLDLFKTLWWCNTIIIINLLIVWRIFKYYSVSGGTSCVLISKRDRHGWAVFGISHVHFGVGGQEQFGTGTLSCNLWVWCHVVDKLLWDLPCKLWPLFIYVQLLVLKIHAV